MKYYFLTEVHAFSFINLRVTHFIFQRVQTATKYILPYDIFPLHFSIFTFTGKTSVSSALNNILKLNIFTCFNDYEAGLDW
jgi:hypothetical protein